jgi:hypothetical protein
MSQKCQEQTPADSITSSARVTGDQKIFSVISFEINIEGGCKHSPDNWLRTLNYRPNGSGREEGIP